MNVLRCAKHMFSYWKFYELHVRDSHDYTHLLKKCYSQKTLKEIHAQIIIGGYQENPFLASKLLGNYIKFASSTMDTARKVFDKLPDRDVFLWNMMIQGYSNHGHFGEALSCFNEMQMAGFSLNEYTFAFVLKACGGINAIKAGRMIHGHVITSGFVSDLLVGNALVAFYWKCQETSSSRKVFHEMQEKDIITWNSMISAYVVNGVHIEALKLFHSMLNEDTISPDKATLVGILPSCVQQSAIKEGLWIHSFIVKSSMKLDAVLGSGLILMYANIGRLKVAKLIFDLVLDKNIVVWNSMIKAYGTHGQAKEALKLFSRLIDTGICPDELVFLCLLSACSHARMLSEGLSLFNQMETYGVEKNHEHYACMIDLYNRAGLIDKAIELIRTMPIEAGKDAYGALLGAFRIHNNIEVAEQVAKKLLDLDSENAGRYLMMVKLYENAGRKHDAARLRKVLRDKKIQRLVGASSVEVDCSYHTFGPVDEAHPLKEEIFDTLHRLKMVMEDEQVIVDQVVVNSK